MKKLSKLITITCALLFMHNVSFAEDWYQIEVITFEYKHPNQDQVELWDQHPGEPDWKSGINLTNEATARARKQKEAESAPATPPPPPPKHEPDPAPVNQEPEYYEDEDGNLVEIPVQTPPPAPAPKPAPVAEAKDTSAQKFVTVEEILTGHPEQQAPADANAPAPSASKQTLLDFVSLPSSQYTMGDIERKLNKQGSYRILTHTAWRQAAFTGSSTDGVHIFGGRLLDQDGVMGARYEFEGLVSLRSSRYLHLDVDALLREPDAVAPGSKFDSPADLGLLESTNKGHDRLPVYKSYRLSQSQRVRSNKVYYFDHPLMGVIVKISPYGG